MMKRFVVLIIVLVALSVANAQQTRQVRVPRTPKSLQQKSEDYKNRAIPTGLRGLVPNYAAIGSRPSRVVKATKNSKKPAGTANGAGDNDKNLLNLKMPVDISGTGNNNMFANLTNNKFEETGTTGGATGATAASGATGATAASGATGVKKEPVITGPTGVHSSVEHERQRRKFAENVTKMNAAEEEKEKKVKKAAQDEENLNKRIADRKKKEKEQQNEVKEAEEKDKKDKKLKDRIREVEGLPPPSTPVQKKSNSKNSTKSASGAAADNSNSNNNDEDGSGPTGVDQIIEKERVNRGEIKPKVKVTKPTKKKVFVQKVERKGGATGLTGVDLNKAHSYDPSVDGLGKQYAWIKNGRMGSVIFRQYKKLQAQKFQSHLLNHHTPMRI